MNKYLLDVYSLISSYLPENQFLHHDPSVFVAYSSHRWGLSPFHYAPPFELACLDGIKSIMNY